MPVPIRPPGFPFTVPSLYIDVRLGTGAPPRRDLVSLTGEQLDALRDLLRAGPPAPVERELPPIPRADELDAIIAAL